jgi:UDP-galactopyranose mutase
MPRSGYTEMFKKIISHKSIKVELNTDYREAIRSGINFDKLVYTGPIDEYFGYIHGELPYRTLNFRFGSHEKEFFQEVGVVNYPNDYEYTRIAEFKHLTGQKSTNTVVAYEFPGEYKVNVNEPYYPILREENERMYRKYLKEAEKSFDATAFVGRLAEYRYYNMDQVVARALSAFEAIADA